MLDDRYITATGYLQPETSQPPLIIGFYHITRLFWSVLSITFSLAREHSILSAYHTVF